MGIVPAAGHMVHMPGHIWLTLGEYKVAAELNERASDVDREYFAATNVGMGSYTPYYLHNEHFVMYARAMQGNRARAVKAADAIADAAGPMADAMPEMADSFLTHTLFARARTLAWDDVLKTPEPGDKLRVTAMIRHYARSLALLAKGDREGAARERALFEQAAEKAPADAPWGMNRTGDLVKLASEILAARHSEDAIAHWREAVEIQDAFNYDEPPDWYYPVRESLGAELVRSGQLAEGEAVFREGLRRSPRNGFMLFGLLESLKAQGKDTDEVKREFDAAWAGADIQLTLAVM
jgi:tetratricopeptide (TPR) repeat protein